MIKKSILNKAFVYVISTKPMLAKLNSKLTNIKKSSRFFSSELDGYKLELGNN